MSTTATLTDCAHPAKPMASTEAPPTHDAPQPIRRVFDAATVRVHGASALDLVPQPARWVLMAISLANSPAGELAPLEPVQPGPARRFARRPRPTGDAATPFGLRWRETESRAQGHRATWANRP